MDPSQIEQYFFGAKEDGTGDVFIASIGPDTVHVTQYNEANPEQQPLFSMSRYLFAAMCRIGHAAIGDEPID